MNPSTITITIIAFVCVAGAVALILFTTITGKKNGQAGWTNPKTDRKVVGGDFSAQKKDSPKTTQDAEPVSSAVTSAVPVPATPAHVPPKKDPIVWNVPFSRNPNFYARNDVLDEIKFTHDLHRHVSLVEPNGYLGGVGKSSIAVEYAYRHKEDYSIIWWIRAGHPSTITDDYSSLASQLGLKLCTTSAEEIRKTVAYCLSQKSGWLLIFDNAKDPELIKKYIPGGDNGSILVTSNVPDWWQFTIPITINALERIDAIELMFARTKQTNGAITSQLVAVMQDLPLAIDHACSYISKAGKSITDYLTMFRSHTKRLSQHIGETIAREDIVLVTTSLGIEQAQREATGAETLLSILAFMSPDPISEKLLKKGLEELGIQTTSLADQAILRTSVVALYKYSLIDVSAEKIIVHSMVQNAQMRRLSEEEQRKYAHTAISLISSIFHFDSKDRESRENCAILLPHALAVIGYVENHEMCQESASGLLQEIAVYLRANSEYEEAKTIATKALAIAEIAYGSAHPKVAVCADTLGTTLHKMGDISGAKNQYDRALKIDETAYGPNHPSLAVRLGHLGEVLLELDSPSQARGYLERSLKIAESTYGPDHVNVANKAAGLAQALEALGEVKKAKELFDRALKIDEATYGQTHPLIAERIHSLGMLLKKNGDLTNARHCFERALSIEKATYGHEHPRVAARVTNLGYVLESCGDLEGARDCYEEALAIDEAVYGQWHPQLAMRIDCLGRVLERMGDFKTAKDCYLQAMAIDESVYGSDDTVVADRAIKVGNAYKLIGDLYSACKQYERAIEIHQTVYGPTHIEVANDLVQLGNLLNEMGDSKAARMQLGRALLIRQEQLGLSHPDTESIRKSLASFAY